MDRLKTTGSGSPRQVAASEVVFCLHDKKFVQNLVGYERQLPDSVL